MTAATISFPAMGGAATVVVDGSRSALAAAQGRLADLESKWSRFRPDSEVSRLNANRHDWVAVSDDTRLLLLRAKAAWASTSGAYDPTVLDALVGWGYDRDIRLIEHRPRPTAVSPAPGPSLIVLDDASGTATLGGVGFDPGGIGKGLAADIVGTELVADGADAALINVAGDLRIAGRPTGIGWSIGLEDPAAPGLDVVRMSLTGGGVATSSDRRRRWSVDGIAHGAHHLVDPSTGHPADLTLLGASVLAGEAWWAEALTKAVLVGGLAFSDLAALGASGIGRSRDGRLVGTADLLDLVGQAA